MDMLFGLFCLASISEYYEAGTSLAPLVLSNSVCRLPVRFELLFWNKFTVAPREKVVSHK